jgi:hypothetical protein
MKVIEGKIVEITEQELYVLYIDRGVDAMMPFDEYRYHMDRLGCKVLEG